MKVLVNWKERECPCLHHRKEGWLSQQEDVAQPPYSGYATLATLEQDLAHRPLILPASGASGGASKEF